MLAMLSKIVALVKVLRGSGASLQHCIYTIPDFFLSQRAVRLKSRKRNPMASNAPK